VKITGCTVHYVTADVDGGPIVDQAAVRVDEVDSIETLAVKVHAAEHALLPSVIAKLSVRSI
jgi:phosphoribosylglycinamide formyltransferase-1